MRDSLLSTHCHEPGKLQRSAQTHSFEPGRLMVQSQLYPCVSLLDLDQHALIHPSIPQIFEVGGSYNVPSNVEHARL